MKSQWTLSSAGICELANRYRGRDDCLMRSMHSGSFNFSIRRTWEDDGEYWLIRFPIPGKSMFLDEKVQSEAILMEYIAKETSIPVPKVIGYGTATENPTGLGPFIIMTWIEGTKIQTRLLDPDIIPETLKKLYGEMAGVLLELWKLEFNLIGSFGKDANGQIAVTGRPLTRELNELIRVSGLSSDCTPPRVYHTSTDYSALLLQLQSTQLEQQRKSLYDSQDCEDDIPFKLFCDDLHLGNILVDESLHIVGVLDWEFTYAAPSQFASTIPWWLLLRRPDSLVDDLGPDTFSESFVSKAVVFLEALKEQKKSRRLDTQPQLSDSMRQSINNQSAWLTFACHMTSSVDLLYWDLLDEYCWGQEHAKRIKSTA
ncbi:kinase-like domain-containing protein [Aspergillus venezuelensis]